MSETSLPDFASEENLSASEASQAASEAAAPPPGDAASQAAPDIAPPAPAAPQEPPPAAHHVPLATALEWRDRMTAAEKRSRELEQWRQDQEAQARRRPVPDRFEDPEGYEHYREQLVMSELHDQRLMTSRAVAEMKHGEQVVDEAFKWGFERCGSDPYFNQKVANSSDPVGLVVNEWRREQLLNRLNPEDLDAFSQWKAAQAAGAPPAGQPLAANPAAPPPKPAAPRPSLATAPSAGAIAAPVPRDGGETFDAMFR